MQTVHRKEKERKEVNMVLNVHRNRMAYEGRGKGGKEVGGEGDYVPVGTLSPPE